MFFLLFLKGCLFILLVYLICAPLRFSMIFLFINIFDFGRVCRCLRKNLLGLPPYREIEFSIDLVLLGTTLISKAP
jgi:hypothetical protein